MKHNVVTPLAPSTTEGSLADLPGRNADESPARAPSPQEGCLGGLGTTSRFISSLTTSTPLAKGLVASGISPGDRVALMSRTRYEWTLVDFATWTAGAVVVPVYETSSPEQVEWILSDSGAVLPSLSPRPIARGRRTREGQLPALTEIVEIDGGGIEDLREGLVGPDAALEARRAGLDRSSLATIIYTSGTTGRPKGCRADARQLPRPRRERHREAERGPHAEPPRPSSSSPSRTSSPLHRGALRSAHGRGWGTRPTSRPSSTTLPASSRPSSWRSPESSRRSTTRPRPRPQAGARRRSSCVLPRWRSPTARHSTPRAEALGCGSSTPLRPARLWQASRGHGWSGAVRRVGWGPTRHPPRPLLPWDRRHHPRGIRSHRVHGSGVGQHPRQGQDRHRRPPLPGRRSGSPTTARSSSRDRCLHRLPRERASHGRRDLGRLVPHG